MNSIQSMIGGGYTLAEWHIDGVATASRLTPIGNDTNAIHDRSVARGAASANIWRAGSLKPPWYDLGLDLVGPEGFEPSTKGL